jgi:hypothetical protein
MPSSSSDARSSASLDLLLGAIVSHLPPQRFVRSLQGRIDAPGGAIFWIATATGPWKAG